MARLGLGQFGQPGGLIDRIADHGVLEAGQRTDVTGDRAAGRNADAELGLVENGDQFVVQFAGRGQRRAGGVRVLDGRAEDAQRRIALELVDESAVLENGIDDDRKNSLSRTTTSAGGRVAASWWNPPGR